MAAESEAAVVITVYFKENEVVSERVLGVDDPIPENVLWVDLENPSHAEEESLKKNLGVTVPTSEEIWKNHVLNRMYTENGFSYMTAAVINKVNTPYPETRAVTFILSRRYLVTIRQVSPTSFKNFAQRIKNAPKQFASGADVLEGLLEEIITRVAHNSELVVDQLDALSHHIFDVQTEENNRKNPSAMMKEVLRKLGACADLNSKINESLHSLSRMLSFFRESQKENPQIESCIDILIKDAKSLSQQTAFLSDKVTFQLDATLGMINVEQNLIMKIFSVVTTFFLPPTLIAGVYGMNFEHMPELRWTEGYPIALGLMILVALAPYAYFRRKGWL
ncbi:MAG: magnesium transporter CorA family protein [Alphaproteobacteria bacterium]|nr:magnesium transporter CorA family protein [Alphaproteobacteria bacterium]